MAATLDEARRAKRRAREVYRCYGDVVGVGIARATDGFILKVNFRAEPANRSKLPAEVDGIPVTFDVVGDVRAQARSW